MAMAVVLLGYMLEEVSVTSLRIHLGLFRPLGPHKKTYRAYRAASIPPVLCPIIVAL